MEAIEHLEECAWTRPPHYMAFESLANPVGDYCIYSKTRDTGILGEVNFEKILECLEEEMKKYEENVAYQGDEDDRPWVYTFSASHCMCGWVEYIIVRKDSPESLLKVAGEIFCAISEYPIFDEEAYGEACYEAICEYWGNARLQDRIEYCQDAEVSIFAARRDEIPEEVYDDLREGEGFR